MIDKQNMSEADIRRIFITPAIKCKWTTSCIREEFTFTDGRITIVGQNAKRGEKFRADYLLYYKDPSYHFPIAVVEAKDNTYIAPN